MRSAIIGRHLKTATPQTDFSVAGTGFGADIAIAEVRKCNR